MASLTEVTAPGDRKTLQPLPVHRCFSHKQPIEHPLATVFQAVHLYLQHSMEPARVSGFGVEDSSVLQFNALVPKWLELGLKLNQNLPGELQPVHMEANSLSFFQSMFGV